MDGPFALLRSPAVKVVAVIGDSEFDAMPGCRFLHRRTRLALGKTPLRLKGCQPTLLPRSIADEFEHAGVGTVATASAGPGQPGVAALAILVHRCDVGEEVVDKILAIDQASLLQYL